jgi:hypothetical protein
MVSFVHSEIHGRQSRRLIWPVCRGRCTGRSGRRYSLRQRTSPCRLPPVDFYGPIELRNSATGEDYVVHIASDLPRILRLQNPRVAHTDDLCRVPEVVKSNPQTIDRSVHRPEDSVIDRQPSPVRFDRRRAGTDLHFIPVILHRSHDQL